MVYVACKSKEQSISVHFFLREVRTKNRCFSFCVCVSRGSSVSMETRLRAWLPGFNSRDGQWWEFFSLPSRLIRSGTHPASYPMGTGEGGALTPGLKRPGRGAHRPPPSSADVKKAWSYTSSPQYGVMLS